MTPFLIFVRGQYLGVINAELDGVRRRVPVRRLSTKPRQCAALTSSCRDRLQAARVHRSPHDTGHNPTQSERPLAMTMNYNVVSAAAVPVISLSGCAVWRL